MHKLFALIVLVVAGLLGAACDSTSPAPPTAPKEMVFASTGAASRFVYAAGTAGTVTVQPGQYVTGVFCHATASGATLTITPSTPTNTSSAGAAIPVPAGGAFSLGKDVLQGNSGELGTNSVFVFSGTDSYVVTTYNAGGP